MTFEEAIGELGLEATADADMARRAYLRLIKVRKPEVDPDGFQRAREAYEVVRAGAARALFRQVIREASPPEAKARVEPQGAAVPRHDRTDQPRHDHEQDDARADDLPPSASVAPAAPDAAFAGFLRLWDAVPPHSDRVQRMEIAREAVAALPGDPRAHWLLVKTLSGWSPDTVVADALRDAHQRGHPGFLEVLLLQTPHRARREEIDEATRSDDPSLRLAGAGALASRDPAAAAAVVIGLYEGALPQAAAGTNERAGFPLARALDVILVLYATGAASHALAAERAVGRWMRAGDLEPSVVRGPFGAVWLLIEELSSLPDDFPDGLRRSLAAATRAGDLTSAFHDACTFVAANRRASRRLLASLGSSTPNVAGTLSSAIKATSARRWRLPPLRWQVLIRFVVFPGIYAIFHLVNSPLAQVPEPALERSVVTDPGRRPHVGLAVPLPEDLQMLREAVGPLCEGAGLSARVSCPDAQRLVGDFLTSNCDDVVSLLAAIEAGLAGGSATTAESRFVARAQLSRWQRCRIPPEAPTRSHAPGGAR